MGLGLALGTFASGAAAGPPPVTSTGALSVATPTVAGSGSVVAPFDPSSLSGLTLWLRASVGVTGNPVTAWADQSGNGNSLIVAGPGGMTPGTGINGHATVDSPSGTSSGRLQLASAPSALFSPTGITMFAACKYTGASASTATSPCILQDQGDQDVSLDVGTDGGTNFRGGGCTFSAFLNHFVKNADATLLTDPHYFYFRYDGAHVDTQTDAGTAVSATAIGAVNLAASNKVLFAYLFQGSIGEIITYNRALTDPEIAQVRGWLSAQWGI
jgi:hypothetical protein